MEFHWGEDVAAREGGVYDSVDVFPGAYTVMECGNRASSPDEEEIQRIRYSVVEGSVISSEFLSRVNQDRYTVHIDAVRGGLATFRRQSGSEDMYTKYTEVETRLVGCAFADI